MSRFKKLSHTIYECKYHVVICPKYRHRIFNGEIGEYARQEIYVLCKQKELLEVLELSIQEDHIHLVMSMPPKYAFSEIMGYVKGKLSLRLFQRYERVGKRYWGRHLWSRGYCVSTVGLTEELIRRYVKHQEKMDKQIEGQQKGLFK
ncbi:MAG: transposase [Thermodesulfovibrio sp. RBG_19FT_COMBO_42_12]|nr:MAG: transposase [Thermodesulfovibrio sp. RBG_19FT_COMBO_42_12]